jgi:hypothetical protein
MRVRVRLLTALVVLAGTALVAAGRRRVDERDAGEPVDPRLSAD